MPSPAPAADLERVLHRAAAECESADAIWFGEVLPRSLKSALDAAGKTLEETGAELAFIERLSKEQNQGARLRAVGPASRLDEGSVD